MLGLLENVDRRIRQMDRWLPPIESSQVSTRLWRPIPNSPQTEALDCPADELFYGGSAGGGKSWLLIGLALTRHRKSIIFRREYPQLKDIVQSTHELLGGTRARYNTNDAMWRAIPGGRTLEFGAVQYEHDVNKYKGRAHDLKAFDEVGELSEYQYRFLTGWLRTTVPGQRTRVVCTGNPPTHAEGEWVIRYWAPWLDGQHPNPARPGELRWFTVLDGRDTEVADGKPFQHNGETVYPRSRTFIPARLTDNPYLASTDYGSVLQALPEPLRTQLLYGDFSVGVKDDPWQVIPTEWVRLAQARWMERADPGSQSALGVDVARGGDDQTVIAPRYGTWFAPLQKHSGISTPNGQRVAGLILAARRGSATVNVDVIGVGASVYDQLAQYPGVRGINFGEGTEFTDKSGRLRFANVRAYAYWSFREALDPATGQGLALPIDNELLADLTAPKWTLRGGRIYVESKQEIIKRLHRSPDCGDAVVLALMADREIVASGEMVNDVPAEVYKSKRRSTWQ